ncbi:ROK family transcriptional regulator [Streptomyces purpurascens]|uniref:ROK family transcriptional regulator n=1 Tax=Streptomyces purpurascens TaxID=1924 RepID=UPI0033C3532E
MTSPADSADVRRTNLSLVLRHIEAHGPCARTEIAAATGLVHASVTAMAADLVERGLVEEAGVAPSGGRGRPRRLLRLVPGRVWTVAVQVTWEYAQVWVADLQGAVVYAERAAYDVPLGAPGPVRGPAGEPGAGRTTGAVTGPDGGPAGGPAAGPEGGPIAGPAAGRRNGPSGGRMPRWKAGRKPGPVAETIAGAVQSAVARAGGAHVGRVVIAVPGPVIGGVVGAAIGFGWGATDLAALVAGHLPDLGCPVEVVNEANVAALAEYHALAAADVSHPDTVVYVKGDIGVSGGLLIGGRVHQGSRGMAGEIGHVPVSLDGRPCLCGSRGCLDTYLSLRALIAAAGMGPLAPGQRPADDRAELGRRLHAGDSQALAALDHAGHALGAALLAVAGVTDAGEAVLGGYLADWAPWLAPGIDARLAGRRTEIPGVGLTVSVGVLGADATLHGAVQVGRDRILDDPTSVPTRGGAAPTVTVRRL